MFELHDTLGLDGSRSATLLRLLELDCDIESTRTRALQRTGDGRRPARQSSVFVRQYAGTVTYWSAGFTENRFRAADGTMTCYPNECYTFNNYQNTTTGAPPFLVFGDDARAAFDVIGANGGHLALDKSVALTPYLNECDQPYGCRDYTDPVLNYVTHFCETYTGYQRAKFGTASSF